MLWTIILEEFVWNILEKCLSSTMPKKLPYCCSEGSSSGKACCRSMARMNDKAHGVAVRASPTPLQNPAEFLDINLYPE